MKRKFLGIGGASVLALGGAASMASAQYTTSFPTGASSDFATQLQLGTVGDNNPVNYPSTALLTWGSGSVSLTGDSYDQTAVALIDSGATSNGMYGDTDAVLNFTILAPGGKVGNVEFGMATRIGGEQNKPWGVGGATPPLTTGSYNDDPIYRLDYAGGTLSLVSQDISTDPVLTLSSEGGITLGGGGDTYQLEMATLGIGLTETIVGTLSQNGTVVGTVSASDPTDQIAAGEVGFYGGGYGGGVYSGNPALGIEATSFSVNADSVPEPASIGLLALGSLGLLARRRARKAM